MSTLLHTQHGGTLLKITASVEGFFLALTDNSKTLNWKVPAFPMGFYESLHDILLGKECSSFMCAQLTITGELQVLPKEREEQPEKFVLLTIMREEKCFEIKLRDTEVLKLYEILVQYWTC